MIPVPHRKHSFWAWTKENGEHILRAIEDSREIGRVWKFGPGLWRASGMHLTAPPFQTLKGAKRYAELISLPAL